MDMPTPTTSGNGYPSWKWNDIDSVIKGDIVSDPAVLNRPKVGKPGEFEDQLVFEVHSDDELTCRDQNGKTYTSQDWSVWVKVNSQPYRALFDAVKACGAESKFEKGDRVSIRLAGREDIGKPSPMKVYVVQFKKGEKPQAGANGQPAVSDLL